MMCVIYKYDVPNSVTTPRTDIMHVMQQTNRGMFGRDWAELASCVDTCRVRKKNTSATYRNFALLSTTCLTLNPLTWKIW